ncbi:MULTISPECIES: ABC transporter ATP-binding protein [unclassified Facklamia]|uniref:ABC transporter ATP-binding protein n=1 Tax=Aerococcaceae TaxID=186827 RepID=UPI0013B7B32E|nr:MULTISPECIES: ABC transporter ATP-binding protein [unclassified Facklamia]MBS4462455.1 ABC transporter ATP-binding protein [Aerococcaceae bacterium zg-B36]NEW65042.1 ATP-binding cassette domain-containing protein [Facklamia sp. 252]NEW68623.1 ATP-binding cassette domain-containing protein [Facklamia sp. 253]QQD65107.1 ABC transporter ATP-binding protein [Aerococcaceae bacterium zg-252]
MLEVKHLVKTFGSFLAVDDVSFTIEPGSILGIIGQNGSGKTTIFRMILDFLTPENKGEVLWNHKPLTDSVYDVVGYLPEERGLYEKMTIEQQIMYFAQLRGMKKSEIATKIDEWLIRFNVKGKRTDKIKSLSKGNQQKVQLIATLIHEPKLVILDEPFSGLDPVNADFLKKGILALRDKGSCIIFSSHNMNNVEEICDKLVMIHNGKQVLYGTLDEVRGQFGKTKLLIETTEWTQERLAMLPGVAAVQAYSGHQYMLQLEDESFGKGIFDEVAKGEYLPVFYQQAPSLEEIFKMKAGESNE